MQKYKNQREQFELGIKQILRGHKHFGNGWYSVKSKYSFETVVEQIKLLPFYSSVYKITFVASDFIYERATFTEDKKSEYRIHRFSLTFWDEKGFKK